MTAGHGRTHRYLDTASAPPLFPFAWGLGYANVTSTIYIDPPSVKVGESFTATISLKSDRPAHHVVTLFAASVGGGFGGAPLQSLVSFEKVHVHPGVQNQVRMNLNAGDDLLLGLEQQPLPGVVRLWTGDAGCRGESCAKAELHVSLQREKLFI